MVRNVLRRVFVRAARALGILEIQYRIDRANARLDAANSRLDAANSRLNVLTSGFDHAQSLLPSSTREGDKVALQSDVGSVELQLERRMDLVVREMELRYDTLRSLLDDAQQNVMNAAMQHAETLVNEMRNHLAAEMARTRRSIDHVRRVEPAAAATRSAEVTDHETPTIDDALYVSLEDRFRGDKTIVRERQLDYLDLVRAQADERHPVVDLGCGRGEWLSILREHGVPAHGIDGNSVCVAECTEAGLHAELGDLLAALSSMPDESCGAVTMFQVLEHLPFPKIVEVMREARRVLVAGGCFIGEIPNAETLKVSAGTFWIDPTHTRPIHPELLVFLAGELGFASVDTRYSSPIRPEPDFAGLPETLQHTFKDWHRAINGPGDFAIIARV